VVRRCVWSRNLVNEEALANWWLMYQKKIFLKLVLVRAVNVCSGTGGIALRMRLRTAFSRVSAIPSYSLRCMLLRQAVRSNAGMANRLRDFDLRFEHFSAHSLLCGSLIGWVVGCWIGGCSTRT
jgi:hypothetical protein